MTQIKKCLFCYQPLGENETDFHSRCSKKIFGQPAPPQLAIDKADIQRLAEKIVIASIAVTGVQAKLSLAVEAIPGDPKHSRFTIVGLWGNFILKPPSEDYHQ